MPNKKKMTYLDAGLKLTNVFKELTALAGTLTEEQVTYETTEVVYKFADQLIDLTAGGITLLIIAQDDKRFKFDKTMPEYEKSIRAKFTKWRQIKEFQLRKQ